MRFSMMRYWFFEPFGWAFKMIMISFVIVFILSLSPEGSETEIGQGFDKVISRSISGYGWICFLSLWGFKKYEYISGYSLTKKLFGRPLEISVIKDRLTIKGRLMKKSWEIDRTLNFEAWSCSRGDDEAWKNSEKLILRVSLTKHPIIEIFDKHDTDRLETNANLLFQLGEDLVAPHIDTDKTQTSDDFQDDEEILL